MAPPNADLAVPEYTVEKINEYYLDLESLLGRVEKSTTLYQVLGLERAASTEQIRDAYAQAVSVLRPPHAIKLSIPEELTPRIERAFDRVAQAFSVLANYGKRVEYDNSFARRGITPLRLNTPKATESGSQATESSEVLSERQRAVKDQAVITTSSQQDVFNELSQDLTKHNRRRCERFPLSIPVHVTGHDQAKGKWSEMAQTINVGRAGISFHVQRRLFHGMVLHLTLPLPVKLRNHGHADLTYKVYAIVRRVEPPKDGSRVVGVEFLSEHPPRGYLDKPWNTFRTVKWSGRDRRREPRKHLSEPVEVEYLSESLDTLDRHLGLTENVSPQGVRVYVRTPPPDFDWIRIVGRKRNFEGMAALRNRFTGGDGFERLCLQFMERKWPI